jgi:hypothetical protein
VPRYHPLTSFLTRQRGDTARLEFGAIEHMIGDLPASARENQSWWTNDPSKVQAEAWLSVGWEMASVDLINDVVTFRRIKSA